MSPLRRRGLLPGLLLLALLTPHCSSTGSSDDDDDGGDGGASGETADGGTAGTTACTPRATRSCQGEDGCTGRQVCTTTHTWTTCVCGTGGSAGSATGDAGHAGHGDSGSAGEGGVLGDSGTAGMAGETGGAGSGGTSGAKGGTGGARGGTGGSGGISGCGASVGYVIVPEPVDGLEQSGFVDASTNCMGISGPVTFSHDAWGSTIAPASISTELCVTGHLEQITEAHPADEHWGARISIQLNNPDKLETPGSYSGLDHGVSGFKFTLSGATVPPEIRPTYRITVTDTPYCKRVCASGLQSALYSESDAYCEDDTGALQSGVAMTMLEFVIPARSSGDVEYDFCIGNITGITDNVSVGEPGICTDG